MAVTKTSTELDPIVFIEGEDVDSADALAVLEMQNYVLGDTVHQTRIDVAGLLVEVTDSQQFRIHIPPWAHQVQCSARWTPTSGAVAVDYVMTVGGDSDTYAGSAGETSGSVTLDVSSTGTGVQLCTFVGSITAGGPDTALVGSIEVRVLTTSAANLPTPTHQT